MFFYACTSPKKEKVERVIAPKAKVEINYQELISDTSDELILPTSIPLFGDLDSILSRRMIRVLVPYSPTYYYFDGKTTKGFSFEILNMFEEFLNKSIQSLKKEIRVIYIPVSREYLIPLLEKGFGDIAVGGVIIDSIAAKKVDFSRVTHKNNTEVIVSGANAPALKNLRDLSGKKVYVRKKSSFYSSLIAVNESFKKDSISPIHIIEASPYLDEEDIIQLIHKETVSYTVMLNDMADHWKSVLNDIVVYDEFPLKEDLNTAWAIRKNTPQLTKKINAFLRTHKQGSFYGNVLYNKYFRGSGQLKKHNSESELKKLSTTKHHFQKYGGTYNLDWLLLVAQGFQESGLNQQKKSSAGAVGIMQIKPTTASWKPIGIENVWKIENNIHAAVKYIRYIIDRHYHHPEIDLLNKHLLALASYNAGPAKINSLRKKALNRGLDPNVWFNNVEVLTAEHIGKETVHYVSNIYKYYVAYRLLVHFEKLSGKSIKL